MDDTEDALVCGLLVFLLLLFLLFFFCPVDGCWFGAGVAPVLGARVGLVAATGVAALPFATSSEIGVGTVYSSLSYQL
ncbi:hypothetical protein F4801DRAFT_572516 [Xylaria longipes]|nr:hypothetical protein F4801DRAFT_572516 [Xylaria longipes]